jgi:hypothetical protein
MRTVINGQDVYLDGDNIPEFTYSLNELTDFTKVRGSSSTTFEVPASNSARVGLGGPAMQEEVIGEVPIRIGEGGQVLFEGVCKPMEWTEDSVQVVAYGDNATWFDRAKSTKCVDVDLGVTQNMSVSGIAQRWQAERFASNFIGYISQNSYSFPLIDYGSMGSFTASTPVTLDKLRFAVSVRALLAKFFKDNGFTIKIEGTLAGLWPRLMLPSAGHNYQVANNEAVVVAETTENIGPFDVISQAINTLTTTSNIFILPATGQTPLIQTSLNGTVKVVYDITIRYSSFFADETTGVNLFFLQGTTIISSKFIPLPAGVGENYEERIQGEFGPIDVIAGQQYVFTGDLVDISSPSIIEGSNFKYVFNPVDNATLYTGLSYKVSSAISPSLNIGDVISALANILRLVITTDQLTNTVTFQHYDDYLLDVSAGVDWSDRLSHNDLPAKVMPEVPERYLFKYTTDDKDERLLNYNGEAEWTAEGRYDTTGREDENVTTVKFAATQQGTRFGGVVVPVIKEVDKVTDYVKCKPRILVHGGYSVPGGTAVTLSGVGGLTYAPRYYFAGSGGLDINLGFGDDVGRIGTLSRYWRASLLRATKPYLRGEFRVYDDEFMNFEFARPRLVNDGYGSVWMYVQTIKGKRFGDDDLVDCELIPV